jgi:hypothetical protein
VAFEKSLKHCDGGDEVVAEHHEQIDVVEVFVAVKAMSEVVARVHGGLHFAAVWAEEESRPSRIFVGGPLRPRAAIVMGIGKSLQTR